MQKIYIGNQEEKGFFQKSTFKYKVLVRISSFNEHNIRKVTVITNI